MAEITEQVRAKIQADATARLKELRARNVGSEEPGALCGTVPTKPNWLIIGSTAAYRWFPDMRKPADLDLLTPATIKTSSTQLCFVDTQWHAAAEHVLSVNRDPVFADPDVLYTLKVSHAHWNIKWQKTMDDIEILRRKGCKLNFKLYEHLVEVWTEIHGKKHVNMNQSMDTFFKDAVQREYDHEYLHELVAFNGRPMHERLRPDIGTAWCDQNLFNALTPDEQAQTVLEEIMATAIERSRLNNTARKSQKFAAMNRAHFLLCTSMTKGWFARYLILNRFNLLYERKEEWLTIMNKALSVISTAPTRACTPRSN
jgi:hypothetical protein